MTKKTTGTADKQKSEKAPVIPMAFDIPEFCVAYSVGRSTAYEEIRTGRLQIMKVGKLTRISTEAAETWRREREADADLDPPPPCAKPRKSVEAGQPEAA